MIPESWRWEVRIRQLHRLPWALPASVVIALTPSDLDRLSAAVWSPEAYAWVLRQIIVTRIEGEGDRAA